MFILLCEWDIVLCPKIYITCSLYWKFPKWMWRATAHCMSSSVPFLLQLLGWILWHISICQFSHIREPWLYLECMNTTLCHCHFCLSHYDSATKHKYTVAGSWQAHFLNYASLPQKWMSAFFMKLFDVFGLRKLDLVQMYLTMVTLYTISVVLVEKYGMGAYFYIFIYNLFLSL